MPPSIRVTIIDDDKAEKCEGHCGLDLTSPRTIEEITGLLKNLYGETVELEFLDLAESTTSRSYPEIVDRIRKENLALPLLLINGNLRIAGYFDIYQLQNTIQVEIEMEWL